MQKAEISPRYFNVTHFALQEQKVFFKCKEGHSGQFVYIRDDRPDKEYFGLCEVEVFHYKGNCLHCAFTNAEAPKVNSISLCGNS